ncbi:MAG: hypothetical protein ABIJ12_11960 [bacterium]
MKKLILILCMLWLVSTLEASIVNNSSGSPGSEDSLSITFFSLDSLGNPTTADSIYVLVIGPEGSVVFKDSMATSDSRITSTTIRSKQFYSFSEQVSNIDGSGTYGTYSLALLAKKNTGGLLTPNNFQFQIISTKFSDQIALIGDSVFVKGGIVDTNKTDPGLNDSTSIANWVWNTPHSNHTNTGTYGKYLDTEISGIGGGSGAYSISIIAYDTSNSQTVAGASVVVRNINQSSLIAVGRTDSNGEIRFNLDADSFIVITTAPGYIFNTYDTVLITGTGIDTTLGYAFDIDLPTNTEVCRVWGYLYDFQGHPQSGATVAAFLPGGIVKYNEIIISPFAIATVTNSFGQFYLDLIPSEKLDPSDSKYEISIRLTDGTILRHRLLVPNQVLWRLTW